jgi:hypothetical protein
MCPVGWEALGRWGDDATRIEPLTGGVGVNEVWSVRVNGHLAVGRLGGRSDADLTWETELLQHLDREGLTVPVPIPDEGGPAVRRQSGGYDLRGRRTARDGGRLASRGRHAPPAELGRLTQGWPQRPGWRSSTDLVHAEPATKIDLGAIHLRALLDAEQRGRGSSDVRHASSTATPTRATSA